MNLVILAPSSGYDPSNLPDLPKDARVTVVGWDGTGEGRIGLRQSNGVAKRVRLLASRTMPGRVLVRLTPLDSGATFWRATRRSKNARRVIRSADVLVAAERDAGYAAWRWTQAARRAGDELPTVFGYPAARAVIERLSA